jgi:prepilin-type processing-associated H-X9-DG protein
VRCSNNLRQIGLALNNYNNNHGFFPAASYSTVAPGNPSGTRHSWRAFMLPYIEQGNLQGLYRFDRNWNAAENVIAAQTPVKTFECPSVPTRLPVNSVGSMSYPQGLAPTDYDTMNGVKGACLNPRYQDEPRSRGAMYKEKPTRIEDIGDGTSCTLIATECAARPTLYRNKNMIGTLHDEGMGWADHTGPFSLDGADATGLNLGGTNINDAGVVTGAAQRPMNATNRNEVYSFHPGGANVVFCDGSVAFLTERTKLSLFAAIVTRNYGVGEDLVTPGSWE